MTSRFQSFCALVPLIVIGMVGCDNHQQRATQLATRLKLQFSNEAGDHPKRAGVETFLRRHKIAYHVDSHRRMIFASMPHVERHGFVTTGIYLQFCFDERDRLLSYSIEAVPTGP